MNVEFSSRFLRSAKKLTPGELQRLSKRIEWFRVNPRDQRLKCHMLEGNLKNVWSFFVTYSKRVLFTLIDPDTALCFSVGTHDEVYR